VPRAGIEPAPRTDIGYRPVTQIRQTRCEPLGHHVPHFWPTELICNQFFVFLRVLNALCVCLHHKHPRLIKQCW
jgi:hypothetical protein